MKLTHYEYARIHHTVIPVFWSNSDGKKMLYGAFKELFLGI